MNSTIPAGSAVPFSVGSAIARTFQAFAQNLLPFLGISAIASIPHFILYYLMKSDPSNETAYNVIDTISDILLTSVCQAMILYATFQHMRGRPVRIGESVARGLARMLPVIGTSITVTFSIAVGMLLCIVPGIIASVGLTVALPVCVVEKEGPFTSMSRSYELTSGHRWAIFGAMLVVGLVSICCVLGDWSRGCTLACGMDLCNAALSNHNDHDGVPVGAGGDHLS
jgi:hypothetical protein